MAPAPFYGYPHTGQALRGSSEFHAWGDSNLYLRRLENQLSLIVEHRAAPSLPPIDLELAQRGESLALELRTCAQSTPETTPSLNSVTERIIRALGGADRPLSAAQLRQSCPVRKSTFYAHLEELTRAGRISRSSDGYRLVPA